jgi:hypothetical protein
MAKTRDRSRSPMRLSDDSSHSSAAVSCYDEDSDQDSDISNQSSDASDGEEEDEIEADDDALSQESLQYLRHTLNMAEFGSLHLTVNGLLEIIDGLEPSVEAETDEETEESDEEPEDTEYDSTGNSDGSETSETSSAQGTDEEGEDDFVLPQEAITLLQAMLLAATNMNLALSKNMLRTVVDAIHK